MKETITLGDITIAVTRKDVRNVHLSVHPPLGHVTLVAPTSIRYEVVRAYAVSKLQWIREQHLRLTKQARETPRAFTHRESHFIWGRRYLLSVREVEAKPFVRMGHRSIILFVRPGSTVEFRSAVMQQWRRNLMHEIVPGMIKTWELRLGVKVKKYFLQRMKTKWGSCNHKAGHIRLNTELVKKPKDLLEYVIVHELLHLIEPTHNAHYRALLDKHYPFWREARQELNALPLGHEEWG
jgi:predicted metal-dependent hydrolase